MTATGWVKDPDTLSVRTCPKCKRELPLRKFFQGKRSVPTRRCNRCIQQAKSSPGGLLGYRNPR